MTAREVGRNGEIRVIVNGGIGKTCFDELLLYLPPSENILGADRGVM